MRHHTALQHGDNGPWHFVSSKPGKGAYPIGYCTSECTHADAAEAVEHYRQYLLDSAQFVAVADPNTLTRCVVGGCDTFTHGVASWDHGWHSLVLCDDHRNRETLERLALPPGVHLESWQS